MLPFFYRRIAINKKVSVPLRLFVLLTMFFSSFALAQLPHNCFHVASWPWFSILHLQDHCLVFRCKYSKMDLEIILDASASREEVFEHQRELALSLIERLPIGAGETHVAVGINSFTEVPTLRQTLGLCREKEVKIFSLCLKMHLWPNNEL